MVLILWFQLKLILTTVVQIFYIYAMHKLMFLSCLFFVSCAVDELPPCNGEGVLGEICKEYQFVFGRYNGVNDYQYDLISELVTEITTKRKNGSVEGVTRFSYNDNQQVSLVTLEDSKGNELTRKKTTYNTEGDVLLIKITGQVNTELIYKYSNDLLITQELKENSVTLWLDSLEYYSGTTNLYRKLRYVKHNLSQIVFYDSFANNIKEEKIANANGIIQSKKVFRFDDFNNILEELSYSSFNSLISRVVYVYEDGLLERVERYNNVGEEYEHVNYQRF